uniref:ATPase inhibitor, mitochondrial n=1 Tax=Rhinolophus ferrumequinum TaxID=59479 RepID=A0A671DW70_RHIFE
MAVTASALMRRGVWDVRAMQARNFNSERTGNVGSSAGSVREAGGAFGKRDQAEEERYFRPYIGVKYCHMVQNE